MKGVFLRAYGPSDGAKLLAEKLEIKRLKLKGSTYRPREGHVIINWGNTTDFPLRGADILNDPENVRTAVDKLDAFRTMSEAKVPIPEFTDDIKVAKGWFANAKNTVIVCRTMLRAAEGRGIVIAEKPEDVVKAPLYTRYVPKKDEYRIHVFMEEVIDVQRKALKKGVENPNWKVRNTDNGFVFVREGVNAPEAVQQAAIAAVRALGLDFGAVDVVWNDKAAAPYVLEVNTAPGIAGTTVDRYAAAINKCLVA